MFYLSQKLIWCSLLALTSGGVGLAVASQSDTTVPPLSDTKVPPVGAIAIAGQPVADIPFKVCGEAQTWARPTQADQTKKLQSLPRYEGNRASPELKALSQRFWQQEIF